MSDLQITITIHRMDGEFYTNASTPYGDFICTVAQKTLDMSLASAMEFIRDRFASVPAGPRIRSTCKVCGDPADIGSGYCETHETELVGGIQEAKRKAWDETTLCPICAADFDSNAQLQEHMKDEEHVV